MLAVAEVAMKCLPKNAGRPVRGVVERDLFATLPAHLSILAIVAEMVSLRVGSMQSNYAGSNPADSHKIQAHE